MVWPARRAKKLNWCQPVYPYSTALLPDDDSRTVTKMNDPNQQLNNDEQEAAALDALLALLDAPVAVPVPAPVQGQNPVPVPAQVPVPEALRNYQWRVTWYEEGDEPLHGGHGAASATRGRWHSRIPTTTGWTGTSPAARTP
jgi:hypothetical protein